jgi:hypothetical protein
MFKLVFILPCLLLMFQPLNAKVEAPNYKFDIATFDAFMPGQKIAALEQKHGKGEALGEKSGARLWKFKVTHPKYQFAVMVQERDGEVLDFFAKLPSYFLHDVFLQSLVNKFGKQNEFKRVGEEAHYVWNQNDRKMVYNGTCTITCFPVFLTAYPTASKDLLPLLEQMRR